MRKLGLVLVTLCIVLAPLNTVFGAPVGDAVKAGHAAGVANSEIGVAMEEVASYVRLKADLAHAVLRSKLVDVEVPKPVVSGDRIVIGPIRGLRDTDPEGVYFKLEMYVNYPFATAHLLGYGPHHSESYSFEIGPEHTETRSAAVIADEMRAAFDRDYSPLVWIEKIKHGLKRAE